MNALEREHGCWFDIHDPRFARVQRLFSLKVRRPEAARALLRELRREWLAKHGLPSAPEAAEPIRSRIDVRRAKA
jgi:hypothetical protein